MKITCYILICLLLFPGFIPITTAHTLAATSSVFANEKISSQAGNASTHPLWQVVMYEDFEGDFPGQWTVSVAPGAADAYWGKEDYNIYNPQNPYDGNFAAYCAKNGSQAVILPGYYPPNMDTTMTGGPFDLSLATDATFSFVAKSAIGGGQDRFEYSVSLDGVNFFGDSFGEEDNSERLITLDMKNVPGLGNICGQPQVWVSFRFVSDHVSENRRGITVDDVLLSQWVPQGSPPQITSISPDTASAGTDTPVTITGTDFGETEGIVEFWQVSRNYKQADVISWSDTEIICTVPSGASGSEEVNGVLYGVRVFGPGGWSRDHPFTVTFSYSGVKWPGDNPCGVRFVVNNITSDCTGALEAIISAAQTWNRVTGADFYFEYGGTDQPGDFVVTWRDDGPGGGTAYGGIHKDSVTGEIISAQIVFNDYHDWSTGGSMNYDIQRTATHEFGHWLMLDDLYGEDNRGKMMFGGASSALAPEDIEGIRWIYPGTGTRGQYHLSVTNNTANPQEVYFKSDIDAEFTRSFTVPAGETKNSWWEVAPAGSRQVSIRWTDPADGAVHTLSSNYQDVPIEGDTEYTFTLEPSQPANQPPVLNPIGDRTGIVGELIQFTISATDLDNDSLMFSAANLPDGAFFDENTHTFTWTPAIEGTYTGISFCVTDSGSEPVCETISIMVEPAQPESFSLTITTQGQGTVTKTPDEATYQAGNTVQLTAVPADGWNFSHWTGDVANPAAIQTSVVMDGDKNITAYFLVDPGEEPVSIPDAHLEAKIRAALGKPTGDIYPSEMASIVMLDASEAGISDITGLEYCTGLQTLVIYVNSISDISPLASCTSLQALYLPYNPISDISPLSGLTQLRHLYLCYTQVTDLSALAGLTNLQTLWSTHNSITDISPLQANTGLGAGDEINLSYNLLDVTPGSAAMNVIDTLIARGANVTYLPQSGEDPGEGPYTLTITRVGQGAFTVDPVKDLYEAGEEVDLEAIPDEGWSFTSWSGDLSCIIPKTTLIMDGDKDIVLTFTQNSQSPGGSVGGGGGGVAGDKRFTNVSGSATSEGVLWEDVTALSTDIQAELRIQKGTSVLNGNGYPAHTITISKAGDPQDAGADMSRIGNAYDFTPDGTTFQGPATLMMYYDPADLPVGVEETDLQIACWDEETGTWAVMPSRVDSEKDKVTAEISHFSRYTIVVETRPAQFSLDNLSVTPGSVEHGAIVTVTASVSNDGDLAGTYNAICKVDGSIFEKKSVSLKGGESRDIEFTLTSETSGLHTIDINGFTASFEVMPTPASFSIENPILGPDTILAGENITVAMTVVNIGKTGDYYLLECCVDGEPIETQNVYVPGEASEEVELTLAISEAGLHSIDVNGIPFGTATVEPVPEPEGAIATEPLADPEDSSIDTSSGDELPDNVQNRSWGIILVLIGVGLVVITGVALIVSYRAKGRR